MASAECMGGPRAPTPQRFSVGCSVYRQCVLERCGSEPLPPLTMIPGAGSVWMCIKQPFSCLSPRCLQTHIRPLEC
ncbi:hypothetical protein TNCV_4077221 [Trichonephila clavipes]|nr:hypothetical protein TNCV_4077221 [Trichonephila clavipes]